MIWGDFELLYLNVGFATLGNSSNYSEFSIGKKMSLFNPFGIYLLWVNFGKDDLIEHYNMNDKTITLPNLKININMLCYD